MLSYFFVLLIVLILVILPIISALSLIISNVTLKIHPIVAFIDFLKANNKLYFLGPFCVFYIYVFLTPSRNIFKAICCFSAMISILSSFLKTELFLFFVQESIFKATQDFFLLKIGPEPLSLFYDFLLSLCLLNIVFRLLGNWSRLFFTFLVFNRYEYFSIIEKESLSILKTSIFRQIITVTFQRVEKTIIIQQKTPEANNFWFKTGVAAGVAGTAIAGVGVYEVRQGRLATERATLATEQATLATEQATIATKQAAVATERATDLAEVSQKIMSEEEYRKKWKK